MVKRALITGITGQDGAYLAKHLLERGYEVHGAIRRTSSANLWRLREVGVVDRVSMVSAELLEITNLIDMLRTVRPTEVYNLAAQSFVAASFGQPIYTADVDGLGALRLLEAIRHVDPDIRFYQASSSEMFGKVRETPQRETTAFHPRSPYAVAKAFAHHATVNYRESYGMHAVCGILFNHESPLRGLEFVTRKVTATLARIANGEDVVLRLGNLDARRDWGFAGDYVRAMHAMVVAATPDDYVVSTGRTSSVREFVELAAATLDIKLDWSGAGERETARDAKSGKLVVCVDPKFYRPAEVDLLLGDAARARADLGWTPGTDFAGLVAMMAKADYDRARRGVPLE
ncbi:MAG: GDP-mannose 4,6-dehydratase [Rhodospirillales bacterium]|nr:GDP-mannose 4,6-dehydratase [Rhodospirillales bacterium]QQS13730.1 MAG: GDP-mannose 4,6-dehydratase [Rhodospirillales bacterium]